MDGPKWHLDLLFVIFVLFGLLHILRAYETLLGPLARPETVIYSDHLLELAFSLKVALDVSKVQHRITPPLFVDASEL
jgi:hypothetical protein